MTQHSSKFVLSAAALAVSVLMAACGGGEAGPPPDVVPPTLTITDNVSAATATGPVTFTFTFSEDVGSSFIAEDIVVTGGTAGAFTRVSAINYTLVVTPVENSAGTISVSVAAAKFSDLSSNANTAASSATQPYDTVVVVPPPAGTGTLLISWDEDPAVFTDMGAYGGALPTVEAAPAAVTGKALKIVKPAGQEPWGGIYFTMGTAIPFTADRKSITARVYSTRAGAVIKFKAEATDGTSVEVAANETVTAANTWQTLTWNLAGVDPAKTYRIVAVTPDQERVPDGQAYWLDDISLAAAASGGGGASGSTGTCTTPCIDFASSSVGYEGFEGLVSAAQADDPVDAANKVAKFVKGPLGQPWAGATVYTSSGDKSVQAIDFATSKVVTLRVYAPSAGMKITLKVENAANPGINMLKTVTTTQANAWETLTFDFASPTQGGFNPAETYNKVSIFPVFDPTDVSPTAPASDTTFYFDELKYAAVAGGGGSGSGAVTFSAGFSSNGLTANGGAFGGFSGSNQDNFNCSGDPAFCGAGGDFTGGTGSYYFYYYQTPTPATQMYVGMYVLAPGVTAFNNAGDTAGVSVGSRPNLKFTFNQNPEWFNSTTNNFMIVVDLGKRYVAGGNTCRLQLRNVTTPTAAAPTAYTIPWTAFDLVQNCGQSLTVAQALAASPVSQISFQGVGNADRLPAGGKLSGANTSVASNGVYPSTVVVTGAITFE